MDFRWEHPGALQAHGEPRLCPSPCSRFLQPCCQSAYGSGLDFGTKMRCRDRDHLVLCMPTPQEPTPADGLAEDILTHLAGKNQSPCPVAGLGTRRLRGWGVPSAVSWN